MSEGFSFERDAKMRMRDSTILLADVYLPHPRQEGERYPTILMRNSYDKRKAYFEIDCEFFASRDYAVVVQDIRGRHSSGGSHYHGRDEVEDGYDSIEWIAQQPWSNGKVGMTGISYGAALQCAAAISGTPHLSSIFHVKAPSDYFQNSCRRGGAMQLYLTAISLMFASTSPQALADPTLREGLLSNYANVRDWIWATPWKKGLNPISGIADLEQFHLDCQEQHLYNDFWKRPLWTPGEFLDQYVDVPGLYVGGWYDLYREDTFFPLLASRQSSRVGLVIGPWTHLSMGRVAGDVDFGPDADASEQGYSDMQLRWFDYSLKGVDDGVTDEPPVKIFVMGGGDGRRTEDGHLYHGGQWKLSRNWPLPETDYVKFYLRGDRGLTRNEPRDDEGSTSYTHDPRRPVPTIGGPHYFRDEGAGQGRGAPSGFIIPYGPHDQRERIGSLACTTNLPLSARHDVLVFQTPPLEKAVEVSGVISADLWFSSSAVDTDFTIKLIDVYPSSKDYPWGYEMILSDGIMRVSYRDSFETRVLLEPGNVYRVQIKDDVIMATANLFAPGHRIRVDISSSCFPAYDVNPGNGEHIMNTANAVKARNTLFHDRRRPSHVVLPIIAA